MAKRFTRLFKSKHVLNISLLTARESGGEMEEPDIIRFPMPKQVWKLLGFSIFKLGFYKVSAGSSNCGPCELCNGDKFSRFSFLLF